jgi:hypothetical protein
VIKIVSKKNLITEKQAIELADKYLMYINKYALRDNIFATKKDQKWQIVAVTTPIILGMNFEWHSFPIDMETGEVGAAISSMVTLPIADVLRQIRETKDLKKAQKDQAIAKVIETQDASKRSDPDRLEDLKKWFKENRPYLKSVLDFITAVLNHIK